MNSMHISSSEPIENFVGDVLVEVSYTQLKLIRSPLRIVYIESEGYHSISISVHQPLPYLVQEGDLLEIKLVEIDGIE